MASSRSRFFFVLLHFTSEMSLNIVLLDLFTNILALILRALEKTILLKRADHDVKYLHRICYMKNVFPWLHIASHIVGIQKLLLGQLHSIPTLVRRRNNKRKHTVLLTCKRHLYGTTYIEQVTPMRKNGIRFDKRLLLFF